MKMKTDLKKSYTVITFGANWALVIPDKRLL